MQPRYALTRVTGPAKEPLTLEEAKAHLRVQNAAGDALIGRLIKAARHWAETYTARALITQTWELGLDRFPVGEIEVPRPPLKSVESITYIDSVGGTQVLAAGKYRVDADSEPGRITPVQGGAWPTTRAVTTAVTVRFTAGYGAAGSHVPEDIRQAMLLLVGSFYEHREDIVVGETAVRLPRGAEALLNPYRMVRV